MTSFSKQLSAATSAQLSAQLDAQLRFFSTFTSQAFDNASRIVALNLSTSRESVERSSRTFRQLIGATQPRDLAVLRTHTEEQMRSLVDYGRELFNIAVNNQPVLRTIAPAAHAAPALAAPVLQQAAARTAGAIEESTRAVQEVAQSALREAVQTAEKQQQAVQETVQQAAQDTVRTASEATTLAARAGDQTIDAAGKTAAAAAKTVQQAADVEPVVLQHEEAPAMTPSEVKAELLGDAAPVAEPKQIAKAAGKGAPKAAVAPHPMAAPVEDKDSASIPAIPTIAPAEGKPPKRRK